MYLDNLFEPCRLVRSATQRHRTDTRLPRQFVLSDRVEGPANVSGASQYLIQIRCVCSVVYFPGRWLPFAMFMTVCGRQASNAATSFIPLWDTRCRIRFAARSLAAGEYSTTLNYVSCEKVSRCFRSFRHAQPFVRIHTYHPGLAVPLMGHRNRGRTQHPRPLKRDHLRQVNPRLL